MENDNKKNKKHKKNKESKVEIYHLQNTEEEQTDETKHDEKKKHKKKRVHITDNVENPQEEQTGEIKSKKKKKHKKNKEIDHLENIEEETQLHDEGIKRKHSDPEENSEDEDKPKKKKKKKKAISEQADGEKKGKKSIRQTKREKHAQRQAEAQAIAKDQLKSQCLTYLSQWKHDKQNWKFMKAKQVWLYKNKFSVTLVPDSSWPLLMEYFESAKGNIRNLLLEDANKVIKQMDEWIELNGKESNKNNEDETEEEVQEGPKKPDESSYKRARDLIQCLQE